MTNVCSKIILVIILRKYYLFIIKKEYYNAYKNKSYVLYKILENLYSLKSYDFSYGINIYKELCLPFSVKLLSNYINNRIYYKKMNAKIIKLESKFEETYLQIDYPCAIIKTNVNIPQILKIFHIYNKDIFICDFQNEDYFWLSNQIKNGNFPSLKHIIM